MSTHYSTQLPLGQGPVADRKPRSTSAQTGAAARVHMVMARMQMPWPSGRARDHSRTMQADGPSVGIGVCLASSAPVVNVGLPRPAGRGGTFWSAHRYERSRKSMPALPVDVFRARPVG